MSASKTLSPKGPLPPGVYWRRRLVLAVGGLVLIFVFAHLVGGSGGSAKNPVAQQAGAAITPTPSASPSAGATTGVVPPKSTPTAVKTSTAPLVLAAPSGSCSPSDINVVPSVPRAVAGGNVTLSFALQTRTNPACTWQMTPQTLAVKITRGGKAIWTSQQCARELPTRSVVIRNVVPTIVTMVWNGHVSTEGCRARSPWAKAGHMMLWAAALGGPPAHAAFDLVLPSAATAPATPTPSVTPRANPTAGATASPTGEPRRRPAVDPNNAD
ncbi:hypothetical protein [Nocardioides montaniterrae]